MDASITFAKKFLEDVLSFYGLNTDVHATHEDDLIELSIPSTHMNGFLIGHGGETMQALQYAVSNALKYKEFEFSRVNVDVADYKKHRTEQLELQVRTWCEEVKKTSDPMELKPMNGAERRIVHKIADEFGLETESIGEGRDRRVVITPADGLTVAEEE
jgi:spoIIIJ-associated protein